MSNELNPDSRPALRAHAADLTGVALVGAAFQRDIISQHADLVADLRLIREERRAALDAEIDLQLGSLAAPEYTQSDFELAA